MKDRRMVLLPMLPVAGMIVAVMVVLLIHAPPAAAHSCSGAAILNINPGDDLDAKVNGDDPRKATTFCVHAASGGTTYNISATLRLRDGDRLIGEPETGTIVTRGPAKYGVPSVKIRPSGSLKAIIAAVGKDIQIQWVDISGAVGQSGTTGSGAGITAGSADGGFLVQYAAIHDNDAAGILSAQGRILNSEFYENTNNPDFLGVNAAAVKGRFEYEAAENYVHNEQGNGLWCDVGCVNDPARGANGFWVHHNLVVDNARSGIRYESSPDDLATGVHLSEPTALIERNEVHGNSHLENRGAISVRDAQNALVRANVFGGNEPKPGAINASDSGRSSRTDLWNVDIVDNVLNGEQIKGCELPDNVVYCANNR
jgi:hypothetical protein